MDDLYKRTALEIFLNNLKTKVPDISENQLEFLGNAFVTGFNMGVAENSSTQTQEMALHLLSL